ncbi:MAG: phosphopentomutase, partial [Nitrospinota bacterium]
HWELMGILSKFPFPVYPNGFPSEIIQNIEKFSGRKIIGNKTASGTAIINELGKEHVQTGNLIVYTSADSVLQIAAHEEVVPLKELHETATKIRASLSPPHEVARVIIRPFLGSPGEFYRTKNRHDYSVEPPQDTVLDILTKQGVSVVAIGKINDIFSGRGVSSWQRTTSNSDGITKLRRTLSSNEKSGLVFVNLIDFDMEFGHRNNVSGYANALTEFDKELPHVISDMERDDLLIITADHGCDPTTVSTDHSREYVPILAYSKRGRKQENLGVRGSFCDVGATIVENFNIETQTPGRSFLKNI